MIKRQIGRSMVEMLGVLALIGIMAIGSVWGIRYAMSRTQAIAILEDVKMFHMLIEERDEPFDEYGELKDTDFNPQTDYGFVAFSPDEDYYRISVMEVPKNVCKAVLEIAGKNPFSNHAGNDFTDVSKVAILINEKIEWSNGKNTELCKDGTNEIMFFFGSVANACYLPCDVLDEDCYYGTCCLRTKRCHGECCKEGEICCNGGCHDSYCPTDNNGVQLIKNNMCVCECPKKKGYMPQMIDGVCGCNKDKGFELKNGKCVCKEGMINLNGECVAFGCYTSTNRATVCTTSSNCHCFIGNQRCGNTCPATDTSACKSGFCYDACMGNTWEYNPATQDFACTTADDRFQCEKVGGTLSCMEKGKSTSYYCGKGCQEDGSGCTIGDCMDVCKGKKYNGVSGAFGRVGAYWGCQYGNISCYKQNTVTTGAVSGQGPKYYCYKNGEICAQNCSNPLPDGTCAMNSCGEDECPEGMQLNDDGVCEREDGVYCELGWDNSAYWCY